MGYGKLNEDGGLISANLQHDGMVSLEDFKVDTDGNYYEFYNTDLTPDTVKIQAKLVDDTFSYFTSFTDAYIQDKITEYNLANNVAFSDINTFPKYAMNVDSVHNVIANSFILWVDKLWTEVRKITVPPTDAEFKAILDSVVF